MNCQVRLHVEPLETVKAQRRMQRDPVTFLLIIGLNVVGTLGYEQGSAVAESGILVPCKRIPFSAIFLKKTTNGVCLEP